MNPPLTGEKVVCHHCGDDCKGHPVWETELPFCCDGCRLVHVLLRDNDLCAYYDIDSTERHGPKAKPLGNRFAFLDDERIEDLLAEFKVGQEVHVRFYLPQIHCSSCVWLLEHLYKLNPGIAESRVDFLQKEIHVVYDRSATTLRKVVEALASTGYEPLLNFESLNQKDEKKRKNPRIYQIAVAGFCFGNIMMLSFPEYFGLNAVTDQVMRSVFGYLNFVLSLPALLFSGKEFFANAWYGLRNRFLNIDAPIALAILMTFGRSTWEIFAEGGGGYLDSMSGIIFFMLVGRYFQDRTYAAISFERDYKSFFPLWVTALREGNETTIPISEVERGERLVIRSEEMIPADAVVISGDARIDYSFVNGESTPILILPGEKVFAGGKQTGSSIVIETAKTTAQSYLTQLWNRDEFAKQKQEETSFVHALSRYFTVVLFSIAAVAFIYWSFIDMRSGLDAVTAVLIVACPCALLLSASFTFGNAIRFLGKRGIYVKGPGVLEAAKEVDHVVFDKTGTITHSRLKQAGFNGALTEQEKCSIAALTLESSHPLSRSIAALLGREKQEPVSGFKEIAGKGLEGRTLSGDVRLGSAAHLGVTDTGAQGVSKTWVEINGEVRGYFWFSTSYREGLSELIHDLKRQGKNISLISGDNNAEEPVLRDLFGSDSTLLFNQTPEQKLAYVQELKKSGKRVMMVGDGLNDAGALRSSDIGISISDDANRFTPSCDVIMDANSFRSVPWIIRYSRQVHRVIMGSFVISILYNIVGIWFSVRAELEPVVAAILMPASSISIVLFTTGCTWLLARKWKASF